MCVNYEWTNERYQFFVGVRRTEGGEGARKGDIIAKIDVYSSIHSIITILQTSWLGEYHGVNRSQRGL